jgi:hypothetical protein
VKEGYEEEVYERKGGLSFYFFLGGSFFWRVLLDLHRGVEFCSREGLVQGAPVCWGFWAWGSGYPYGILELGSCPSWMGWKHGLDRVGLWLQAGQGNNRKVNKTSGRLASDQGILIYVFVLCNLRNMKGYKVVRKLLCSVQ